MIRLKVQARMGSPVRWLATMRDAYTHVSIAAPTPQEAAWRVKAAVQLLRTRDHALSPAGRFNAKAGWTQNFVLDVGP